MGRARRGMLIEIRKKMIYEETEKRSEIDAITEKIKIGKDC